MEQKNGWFAFWQKLMKCLSKQDETGVGDTKKCSTCQYYYSVD